MGAFQDLSGKISGSLKAKKYIGDSKWLCVCQKCGSDVIISTSWFNKNIELGRDGCKHAKRIQIGDRFGYLTIIGEAEDYIKPQSGAHERRWECRCFCGRTKTVLESTACCRTR